MNIKSRIKNALFPKDIQTVELEKKLVQLQNLIIDNILAVQEDDEGEYAGNSYRTYEKAVKEIDEKYQGTAKWGVVQTGNIIDIRAAFIIGQGVKFTITDPEAKNEKEWLERFIRVNNLDRELPQELAKEAEIEGKFLGKLFMDEKEKMVALRFMSWNTYNYTITTDPNDYMKYTEVKWKSESEDKSLPADKFIYKRFGGRIDKPNISPPKIAKCLTQIENLDKAIRDWREIDRLYAAPTPHLECETAADAKLMNDALAKLNFKIKKFFAHTGKFLYTQPDISSSEALEKEITANAKMISGSTGVPVHFLGLPDLMSNRATAENLMELISASTSKERQIWLGGYEEIIRKAIIMWNDWNKKTPLNANLIKVDIPFVTQEQWLRLKDVFLPAYLAGAITLEYFLMEIPGMNVEEEKQRKEKEQEGFLEKAKNEPPIDEEEGDNNAF